MDRAAQRFLVAEEPLGHAGGQDTTGRLLAEIDRSDETPAIGFQPGHLGVVRSAGDKPAVDHPVAVAETAAQLPNPEGRADGGDRLDQPLIVRPGEAVRQDAPVPLHHLAGRFLRPHDDVVGPQPFDLLLRLAADPLADGQKPDHARHADEDPQHRQQRAERMERQALDAQPPGAEPEELHSAIPLNEQDVSRFPGPTRSCRPSAGRFGASGRRPRARALP